MSAKYKEQIDRGIELLRLCQQLQSEKDGVNRPDPFVIDKTKTLDQFAQDICAAINNMTALDKLLPMMIQLGELGRKLEQDGKVSLVVGDDYYTTALKFVRAEHGLD